MADFSIALTVPDAKVSELVDALNWAWGPYLDENGNDTGPKSAAQLRAEFKARCADALKDVFKRHKEYLRSQSVIDTDLNVT